MPTVRVRAVLGPDLLRLPELAPLVGREVEIRVRKARKRVPRVPIDREFLEECRRELANGGPIPTLEEVRAINAKIVGSMAEQIIADREDRF